MKYLSLILICAFSSIVKADFNTAADAYANQNYQVAFDEFYRLAKLGNKRAQYNLGVMYLNGEHVEQDVFQAYAWGKLSEHSERTEFAQIRTTLERKLTAPDLEKAKQTYESINQSYGKEQIYAKLSPIIYRSTNNKAENESLYEVNIISRKTPRFPKEAMTKGIQGWATVGFEIHTDGKARNLYVIDAYPENTFENETMKTVQNFTFNVEFQPHVEPFIVHGRQTIEYALSTRANPDKVKILYEERLQKLRELADQGSAQAQYIYAIGASSNIINQHNKISDEEMNEWLLKSAQNGHIEAQFHLGRNILEGKGCKIEKQKGIDWIVYAAEQGHPRSSRTAYSLLTKNNNLNNTGKPAEFWLKQSAENGDADSQLDYAEFLVSQKNNSTEDLLLAREYLEKQAKQRDKSVKWYQVSASIYKQQGASKQAEKHFKKAEKMAKKLGWKI